MLAFPGCGGNLSPFSPKIRKELNNQNGKIDELKDNTNGIMLDLLKLKNDQTITQRDVENFQQGLINLEKRNENSGIQIFQGDGGLLVGFGLVAFAMFLIHNYRSKALKNEKTAEVLAQQIALYNDPYLNEEIFKAAMNSTVEAPIYHLMVKHQTGVQSMSRKRR